VHRTGIHAVELKIAQVVADDQLRFHGRRWGGQRRGFWSAKCGGEWGVEKWGLFW
jgi:hypothetical protein